jgi:hypothetical protein
MYLAIVICLVVILYLHVVFQLKTSNELEVYEIPMPNKSELERVCNLKQPVVFNYDEEVIMKCTPDTLKEHGVFDIMVYDTSYIGTALPLEKALEVFKKEKATYNNSTFLKETTANQYFSLSDIILRPPLVSSINYDILFGSELYTTRLQNRSSCRNYFLVTQGSVTLKLAPPRNSAFLNEIKNYETQEWYSQVNPWIDKEKKVKFMEITLSVGRLLFIPAYWWYSIRLEKDACVCMFHYKTVMNAIATLPDVGVGMLQRHIAPTTLPKLRVV